MRILTAKQIKAVEENAFKTDSTEAGLMLNAGTACFEKICKIFGESLANSRVAVFCGNGKNAGDGFVIADLLNSINVNADIIICDKEPTVDEPKMYFDKAIANSVKVVNFTDIGENSYDIIVDCIFGIGFHGQPRAPFSEIFDYINDCLCQKGKPAEQTGYLWCDFVFAVYRSGMVRLYGRKILGS